MDIKVIAIIAVVVIALVIVIALAITSVLSGKNKTNVNRFEAMEDDVDDADDDFLSGLYSEDDKPKSDTSKSTSSQVEVTPKQSPIQVKDSEDSLADMFDELTEKVSEDKIDLDNDEEELTFKPTSKSKKKSKENKKARSGKQNKGKEEPVVTTKKEDTSNKRALLEITEEEEADLMDFFNDLENSDTDSSEEVHTQPITEITDNETSVLDWLFEDDEEETTKKEEAVVETFQVNEAIVNEGLEDLEDLVNPEPIVEEIAEEEETIEEIVASDVDVESVLPVEELQVEEVEVSVEEPEEETISKQESTELAIDKPVDELYTKIVNFHNAVQTLKVQTSASEDIEFKYLNDSTVDIELINQTTALLPTRKVYVNGIAAEWNSLEISLNAGDEIEIATGILITLPSNFNLEIRGREDIKEKNGVELITFTPNQLDLSEEIVIKGKVVNSGYLSKYTPYVLAEVI